MSRQIRTMQSMTTCIEHVAFTIVLLRVRGTTIAEDQDRTCFTILRAPSMNDTFWSRWRVKLAGELCTNILKFSQLATGCVHCYLCKTFHAFNGKRDTCHNPSWNTCTVSKLWGSPWCEESLMKLLPIICEAITKYLLQTPDDYKVTLMSCFVSIHITIFRHMRPSAHCILHTSVL